MSPEIKKYIDDQLRSQIHDGNYSQRVNLFDLFGLFQTITDATSLTNALATAPQNVYQQVFIDTSTATKRLYIYDTVGNVWYKVTIS